MLWGCVQELCGVCIPRAAREGLELSADGSCRKGCLHLQCGEAGIIQGVANLKTALERSLVLANGIP